MYNNTIFKTAIFTWNKPKNPLNKLYNSQNTFSSLLTEMFSLTIINKKFL